MRPEDVNRNLFTDAATFAGIASGHTASVVDADLAEIIEPGNAITILQRGNYGQWIDCLAKSIDGCTVQLDMVVFCRRPDANCDMPVLRALGIIGPMLRSKIPERDLFGRTHYAICMREIDAVVGDRVAMESAVAMLVAADAAHKGKCMCDDPDCAGSVGWRR